MFTGSFITLGVGTGIFDAIFVLFTFSHKARFTCGLICLKADLNQKSIIFTFFPGEGLCTHRQYVYQIEFT